MKEDKRDLELGEDICLVHKNWISRRKRAAGGGVLIAYNKSSIKMKERTIRKGQTEVVCAVGRKNGMSRQIVAISVYLPPKLNAAKAKKALMVVINEAIGKAKEELNDPIILVGGDFNKFPLGLAFDDYPDMFIHDSPQHRETSSLTYLCPTCQVMPTSR